jgi:hypothetical protein
MNIEAFAEQQAALRRNAHFYRQWVEAQRRANKLDDHADELLYEIEDYQIGIRRVLDNWETGDLAGAVRELNEAMTSHSKEQ